MKEMRLLRDLKHSNVNSFIGATIEPLRVLIVTDYCAKGSLYVSFLIELYFYIHFKHTIIVDNFLFYNHLGYSRKRRH